MSYNIRYDNPQDGPDRWELRREALAAELLQHRPALIGLQEVLAHQLAFLEKKLSGYRRLGVGRDDGAAQGEFSPIFFDTTRFSLLSNRNIWLSPNPAQPGRAWDAALPRIATLAILLDKQQGDSLWVANTHFDHMGEQARLHSAELLAQLHEGPLARGKKVLLMGDFNAEPGSPPVQLLSRYFTDACPQGKSLNGTFNGFELQRSHFPRIDFIWYSGQSLRCVRYEVPRPLHRGRHVSDHFPVIAQFR